MYKVIHLYDIVSFYIECVLVEIPAVQELDSCKKSMISSAVLQDILRGEVLKCIIHHLGLNVVCLEKCSL